MTAPIEPGHVMSREKYEALQVKLLQEKMQGELLGLMLSSDKVSYEQSCNVQFTPFFSISIPIERNIVEEHRLHKHVSTQGEKSATPP